MHFKEQQGDLAPTGFLSKWPQQPLTLKTHSILLDSTLILWVGFMENSVATGWLQGRASGL